MENDGQEPVTPLPEGQEPDKNDSEQKDPKVYDEEYVKKLRNEAANYRTKLTAFEKAEEDRRQASLSEQQKAIERAEKAEQALNDAQSRLQRSTVLMQAQQKGAVDPDAVYALLDKTAIDFSDDSKVAEAVEALLAAKPYLKPSEPKTIAPNITLPSSGRDKQPYWAGRGHRL